MSGSASQIPFFLQDCRNSPLCFHRNMYQIKYCFLMRMCGKHSALHPYGIKKFSTLLRKTWIKTKQGFFSQLLFHRKKQVWKKITETSRRFRLADSPSEATGINDIAGFHWFHLIYLQYHSSHFQRNIYYIIFELSTPYLHFFAFFILSHPYHLLNGTVFP